MSAQQTQPSPEEMAKMQKVAEAGATAAATAPEGSDQAAAAKDAIRDKADEVGLKLSPQELDALADALSNKLLSGFEQRGAFDGPPEPVQAPPAAPQAAPPPAEQQPAEPGAEPPRAPEKRTWAERYMGIGG